jgi:hypothetical protein
LFDKFFNKVAIARSNQNKSFIERIVNTRKAESDREKGFIFTQQNNALVNNSHRIDT